VFLVAEVLPRPDDPPRCCPWRLVGTLDVLIPGPGEHVTRGYNGYGFEIEDEPYSRDCKRSAISVHDQQDPVPLGNVSRLGAEATETSAGCSVVKEKMWRFVWTDSFCHSDEP